jgi:hypothetical protein
MTEPGSAPIGSARFEFAVVGELGPVLQRALEPCVTHGLRVLTVLRVPLAQVDLVDLVDLLVRLDEHDIEVDGITLSG